MNRINVIVPYLINVPWGDGARATEMWVFDDPLRNFRQEPLVAGMDAMLFRLATHIPGSDDGFLLIFSDQPFPTGKLPRYLLKLTAEELGGAWYQGKVDGVRMHGWLCPGLMRYFDAPPKHIYVTANRLIDPLSGPPQAEAGEGGGRQGGEEKKGGRKGLVG
jgi:hypothetical protein